MLGCGIDRPPILSRALLLRLVSIVGCSISFYLPLAVVPLFAEAAGARSAAGLTTGALLTATVLFELVTPRIVAHLGYRWTLAIGMLLLGVPAAARPPCSYPASSCRSWAWPRWPPPVRRRRC